MNVSVLQGLRARKILLEKIEECIRTKEQQGDVTSTDRDALWLMTQLGGEERKLTMEELKELCLELLFTGHATVASSSTSLFYYLAK